MATSADNRIPSAGARTNQTGAPESVMDRCCESTSQMVRENPLAATLGAFGFGLGIGAAIGAILAQPATAQRRGVAESIGQRVLHSLEDFVPDAVHRLQSKWH